MKSAAVPFAPPRTAAGMAARAASGMPGNSDLDVIELVRQRARVVLAQGGDEIGGRSVCATKDRGGNGGEVGLGDAVELRSRCDRARTPACPSSARAGWR